MKAWDDFTKRGDRRGRAPGRRGSPAERHRHDGPDRARAATPIVTDGPFAETKEQLGGYYLLDCKDLDDALAWAKRDPDARRHRGGPAGHGLRGARLRGPLERGGGRAVGAARGGRRPPVPARVGAGGRHPHPRARRLRPRRGGGAGRVRGGARALAARRRARATRPPGSSAPRATARSTACGATGRYERKLEELVALEPRRRRGGGRRLSSIPDDRLRLFFTCCHPALAPEAQVALTLRTLGGLSTPEVARAFLVAESRRWRSGSCAPSARSAAPASPTRCRRTPTCPSGCARCWPRST